MSAPAWATDRKRAEEAQPPETRDPSAWSKAGPFKGARQRSENDHSQGAGLPENGGVSRSDNCM